ncbi:MAG: hypothetical protein ACRD0G_11615, partial [Acidimicrobiales bacterium]
TAAAGVAALGVVVGPLGESPPDAPRQVTTEATATTEAVAAPESEPARVPAPTVAAAPASTAPAAPPRTAAPQPEAPALPEPDAQIATVRFYSGPEADAYFEQWLEEAPIHVTVIPDVVEVGVDPAQTVNNVLAFLLGGQQP